MSTGHFLNARTSPAPRLSATGLRFTTLKARQVYLIGLCCFKAPGLQGQPVAFTGREPLGKTEGNPPAPLLRPPTTGFLLIILCINFLIGIREPPNVGFVMPPGFEGQRAFIKIYTLTFSVS